MTLIGLLIVLLIVGIAMAMFPVDPNIRKVVYFVLAVLLILWLCAAFGVFGGDVGFVRIYR